MTILETMLNKYNDSVYATAILMDSDAAHAAIDRAEEPVDPILATMSKSVLRDGQTEEDAKADSLLGALERVVINAFVRRYGRAEMVALLNTLGRWSINTRVELCDGLSLSLERLSYEWSEAHGSEDRIVYSPADYIA